MTVSMGIKYPNSGAYRVVPIASSEHFSRHWLPACQDLRLERLSHLHDGALSALLYADLLPIITEFNSLRAWAMTNDPPMVDRIDGVLQAVGESAAELCEYDFG
jgi:hypothetical protein